MGCSSSAPPKSGCTLHYFDMGGRAEPLRMLLAHSGTEYHRNDMGFPNFMMNKKKFPNGQIPALEFPDG